MLHIITEGNSELKNRVFPIPDGVRKLLKSTLENYNGDKTIDGYKRLNNILGMQSISYQEMKRIKNFFDNYNGSDKSAEYILNGGEPMKNWVNNTLNTATKAVHDFKQAKKDAGISNAFIKAHNKDRQNKKKNKPTQVKFNTNNVNKNIMNNNSLKYESILRESIDIEEYLNDYDEYYVLNEFKYSKEKTQNWGVLINPSMYQQALNEFTKFGKITAFPTKYIYQWIGILFKNTFILQANTNLAGHGTYYPTDAVEDFLISILGDKLYGISNDNVNIKITENEFINLCQKNNIYLNESTGIHKDGQYDLFMSQEEVDDYDKKLEKYENAKKFIKYKEMAEQYNKKCINYYNIQTDNIQVDVENNVIYRVKDVSDYLDEIGLYDWMKMPDGSDAWSDFGLSPIFEILNEYNESTTPEEALVIINKTLDVYHQRGDLSSIFIQGGNTSLSKISNGSMYENKRRIICITEEQTKMLKEAMDDQFSLDELSAISSFKGRFDYCTKHLGRNTGKGSSRAIFQLDDEKVLKLAYNEKGIGQNFEEERTYDSYIFPKIFQKDTNGYWLVSEFVLPAKAQDFKHCFNMTFKQFVDFLNASAVYRFGRNWYTSLTEEEYVNLIENNEDLKKFDQYIGDYGSFIVGDMARICNYGLTMRYGEPCIVLLDSGFSEEVYYNYYCKN